MCGGTKHRSYRCVQGAVGQAMYTCQWPMLYPPATAPDPTFRQPNIANLEKRYSPGAAFRFALPGPQVRGAARPGAL